MSDKSGMGAVKAGDVTFPVVDRHGVQPVSADLITEVREFSGIVAIGLAAIVAIPNESGGASPEAVMTALLRMPRGTATNLRNALTHILEGGTQPPSSPLNESVH
jgi:hypothetical protein